MAKKVYIDIEHILDFSGYSTVEVCKGAKINPSTLDRMIKQKMKRIPMKTLCKLICFFRCDIEDIIKIKEE